MKGENRQSEKDRKIDEASKQSFPASDPARHAKPTSTERPGRPKDRQAPLPTKGDIEAARRGDGHKQH